MISVQDLTKRFGQTVALDGMCLEVDRGAVFGLIGPNGAGKTTAMSILSTLQLPDGGIATVDGRDVAIQVEDVRGLIGYMPDFFVVYDGLRVSEYLDFFANAYFLPKRRQKGLLCGPSFPGYEAAVGPGQVSGSRPLGADSG